MCRWAPTTTTTRPLTSILSAFMEPQKHIVHFELFFCKPEQSGQPEDERQSEREREGRWITWAGFYMTLPLYIIMQWWIDHHWLQLTSQDPGKLGVKCCVFLPLLAPLHECPGRDLQEEARFCENSFPGGRAALAQLVVEAEERDVPTHRSRLCHG